MSSSRFTQLPTVENALLADRICSVQNGISVQESLTQIFNLMLSNTILNHAGNPNGNLAGQTYQFCWDTTNKNLYTCTTTGDETTAVWTINTGITLPITVADGGTGLTTTNNSAIFLTNSSGTPAWSSSLSNGQLLIGSTGSTPTPANLTAGVGISITNSAGGITISSSGLNPLVKFASVSVNTYALVTGSMPVGTLPQNTDGTQIMSISYTPISTTNTLEIEVQIQISGNGDQQLSGALFQNTTANAIAVGGCDDSTGGSRITPIVFKKIMTAGTTSAITFNVRAGGSAGADCYFNGQTASQAWGGVSGSTITIKEYAS